MNTKLIYLLTLAFLLIGTVQADWSYVEDVEIEAPNEHNVGEEMEISGFSSGSNLEESTIEVKKDGGWWLELEDASCIGDECSISLDDYVSDEPGEKEFRVFTTAGSSDAYDTKTVEFVDSSPTERYVEFTEFPINWNEGESGYVEAEAYDEAGNLDGQNFKLQVRTTGGWNTIESKTCENDVSLPPVLNECVISAEFTPESTDRHEMRAIIQIPESGQSDYRDTREFTPKTETEDPNFEVEITDADEVTEGEELAVDYRVENTGDEPGRQTIKLEIDDDGEELKDSVSRYVGSDPKTGTLIWDTEDGDAGDYTAKVSSEDDSDSRSVTVNELQNDPAYFDVEITDTNEPVTEGNDLQVNYKIENTGDIAARKDIRLEIDGDKKDSLSRYVTPENPRTGSLIWETGLGSSGSYTAKVSTEDSSDSRDITINAVESDPAFFDVRDISFDSPVYVDDRVEVDYIVKNTGDSRARKTVRLKLDGETRDTESIRLDEEEEKDRTLDFRPDEEDIGNRELSISTNDDERTGSINIRERDQEDDPAFFDVEITDTNSPVEEGDDLEVDYRVENTGSEEDRQDISLEINGDPEDSVSRGLTPGEARTGTLTWDTDNERSGFYTARIESNDNWDSETVSVNSEDDPEASARINRVSANPYQLERFGSTELSTRVTNIGERSLTGDVDWYVGGEYIATSNSVTLTSGESETVDRSVSYSDLEDKGLNPGRSYDLRADFNYNDKEEQRFASRRIRLLDDGVIEDPDEYDLSVFVIDTSGDQVEGAEVSVDGRTRFTSSNGRVQFNNIEDGTYDVSVSEGGRNAVREVRMNQDRSITVRLRDDTPELESEFRVRPQSPFTGEEVSFDGSRSTGSIVSYSWDFGDGTQGSGRTTTHTYSTSGFKGVTLTVRDSSGNTDRSSRVIYVGERNQDPETFDLGVNVEDEETGDEISGARVSAASSTRLTDSDGRAIFRGLEEDVYSVFVSADGYNSRTEVVTLDETKDIDVELDPYDRDEDDEEEDEEFEGVRINSVSMPSSVCRGEDVTARVTFENSDDRDRTFTLSASGLSNQIDRRYYLDDGEEETRTVNLVSVDGSGNERVRFTTGYDSVTRTVQVRDCQEDDQDISVSANPSQIRIGDSVRVSGYVDNVDRGTQVTVGSSNRYRSLGSALTDPDGYYELYVEPSRIGEQSITAEASGMEASTRIDVLPTVSVLSASSSPERVFEGETYEVCADVESQSTPLVVLKQDGEEVDSKYGRGEVCFERRTRPGNYDYEVIGWARGQSSSQSTSVEVMEMDSEVRNFPDQIASVRSGSGMVKVDLYNNQKEFRTYDVSIEGLPRSWTSQSSKQVNLDSGERATEYLYFTPKQEGDFEGTLRIRSDGETIYTERIDISSGGTDREPSRIDRFMMWLGYR